MLRKKFRESLILQIILLITIGKGIFTRMRLIRENPVKYGSRGD